MYRTDALLSLDKTLAKKALEKFGTPHTALGHIGEIIDALIPTLDSDFIKTGGDVFIARDAQIDESAKIIGPCIIDKGATVRHGAYLRGNVIVGKGAVVGNSSEIKNSILFDLCQVPHFNYVGDSILGYRAHLGAGAVISNLRSDKKSVKIRLENEIIDTSLTKMGAIVGDFCEIGCSAVLCPGSVIGRESVVYPLSLVRGFVPEGCIYKNNGEIVRRL